MRIIPARAQASQDVWTMQASNPHTSKVHCAFTLRHSALSRTTPQICTPYTLRNATVIGKRQIAQTAHCPQCTLCTAHSSLRSLCALLCATCPAHSAPCILQIMWTRCKDTQHTAPHTVRRLHNVQSTCWTTHSVHFLPCALHTAWARYGPPSVVAAHPCSCPSSWLPSAVVPP